MITKIHQMSPNVDLLVAATALALYFKHEPAGLPFTYAWWILIIAAFCSGSPDTFSLVTCLGCGLVGSWYACQIAYPSMWSRLMPYWEEVRVSSKWRDVVPPSLLPWLVRSGDLLLHFVPAVCLLSGYGRTCSPRHALQAFAYERYWWWLMEARVFGQGTTTNKLYDFRPPAEPHLFWTAQALSALFYTIPATWSLEPGPLRTACRLAFWLACLAVSSQTPLAADLRSRTSYSPSRKLVLASLLPSLATIERVVPELLAAVPALPSIFASVPSLPDVTSLIEIPRLLLPSVSLHFGDTVPDALKGHAILEFTAPEADRCD